MLRLRYTLDMYDFSKFKIKAKDVEEWLKKEFSGIRTGRAAPVLLDTVKVDSYGAMLPISQVGAVATEDARTLRITPWDMGQIKSIEKAIVISNLGVGVSVDDRGLRVTFPELTAERRTQLTKLAKEKFEQSKVSLRAHREDVLRDIQSKEKEGGIGKDDVQRYRNELQKIVDTTNKQLEDLYDKKEKEILS